MKPAILLICLLLLPASIAGASTYKCKPDDSCYTCILGNRLDDCSVTCNVCTGARCLGAGGLAADEMEAANGEELQPLYRFSTEKLGTVVHPAIGLVFENFWRWHDMPQRVRRAAVEVGGGVLVDGEPHDYTLDARQRGEAQIYWLDIEGFAKFTLMVNKPAGGRQELEFELQRLGNDRIQGGHIMLEAQ